MTKYVIATLTDGQADLLHDLGFQERAFAWHEMDDEMQDLMGKLINGITEIAPSPCYACAEQRPNDPLDEPLTRCYKCGELVHEGCAQARTDKGWLCGGCA